MAEMIGMDSGAVKQLAKELRSHAATLSGVVATVDNIVHQVADSWRGSGSAEFVQSWQRSYRPALLAAQQAVAGLATSAEHNAAQQEEVSAAAGSGAHSSLEEHVNAGVVGLMGFASAAYSGIRTVSADISDTNDLRNVARDGIDAGTDFDPAMQGLNLLQDERTVNSDLISSDESFGHRLETTGDIGNEVGDVINDVSVDSTVATDGVAAPVAAFGLLLGESLKVESDAVNLAGFGVEHVGGIEQEATDLATAGGHIGGDVAKDASEVIEDL